ALPSTSVPWTVTVYVPAAAHTWETEMPDAVVPSPKSQLVPSPASADHMSANCALNATGVPALALAGTPPDSSPGGGASNAAAVIAPVTPPSVFQLTSAPPRPSLVTAGVWKFCEVPGATRSVNASGAAAPEGQRTAWTSDPERPASVA